ncbi:MAG: glyoxalase [Lachnospiraceae bacterium]|nr:glyoxalase [Lachnospiraceae bacterium]
MEEFDELVLDTFLENQDKLFSERVASSREEAEEFLMDCLAVVVDSLSEVREYLDESGMDVSGMSDDELTEASEVFPVEDGRYLIVEG